MTPAARYAAAIDVLDGFLSGEPAEKLLSNWARKNRYAGSKDRAAVRDIVFDCLRNMRSFMALSGLATGRGLAVGHCLENGLEPEAVFTGEGYAPSALTDAETAALENATDMTDAERGNLPDWIWDIVQVDLGADAIDTATALSTRAPVDVRVNRLKATRDAAQAALAAEEILTDPVDGVPTALRVIENPRRLAGSKAFAGGLIELQDAASQAVIERLDILEEANVLDFCAGGGGKTLALAAKAPAAQVEAWDISQARLAPLAERAKRAGATVTALQHPPKGAAYDLVLVDAPCSGSGSWRRNPEGKWRLTQDRLAELRDIQAAVLQQAAGCTKDGGVLVYATCSLFTQENRAQVDRFLAQNPQFSLQDQQSFRLNAPGDGFYCAILQNNSGVYG